MMNRVTLALLFCALTAPVGAQAPPPVFDVKADYLSGQPGESQGMVNGMLALDAAALVYVGRAGGVAHGTIRAQRDRLVRFAIPLTIIANVSNTIDTHGPNGTAVALLGAMALGTKRQDEYVFVTTETDTTTDVVIFQVKKNTSAATAAKITFAVKKAKAAPPA
jgi:hypothetical protein